MTAGTQGWRRPPCVPISVPMSFVSRFSPVRAYLDLRRFLGERHPYELGFLILAMAITSFVMFAFFKDSHIEKVYKRDIIYVQQWPADRTDAQIRAQQAVDEPIRQKRLAEEKARRDRLRQQFKRADDWMTERGL